MNEHCKERFTRSNLAATRGTAKIELDFENSYGYLSQTYSHSYRKANPGFA
jgi:hypothetical protein